MIDRSAESESSSDSSRRRASTIRTSAPDWLFSAVIHALLIALLFSSKAGPGGGGGGTASGGGPGGQETGDIPGDGWIEAQIGSESSWGHPTAVAIETITESVTPLIAEVQHVPIRDHAEPPTDVVPAEAAIVQTAYEAPADVAAPMAATASRTGGDPEQGTAREDSQALTGSGSPANAGLGRGRGDGSRGAGGDGQGGTSLFGIWDSGERIVYVIDRSSSMQHYEKMVSARRELEASLARLDESFEFQVVYYNQHVQPLSLRGSPGLIRATAVNKNRVRGQIRLIAAEGGTRHRAALDTALGYRPTVVYLLTDAESDGLTPAEIANLARRLNGATRIHCIQFGDMPGQNPTADNWLEQLAAATGGEYLHFRTEALQKAEQVPPSGR
jgi:hypothetical protein